MKLRWLEHPQTKEPDMMATISLIVVTVAALKFLFEGIQMTVCGHSISLGHADSMTYAALLSPVLGAQGWKERLIRNRQPSERGTGNVDNPDTRC